MKKTVLALMLIFAITTVMADDKKKTTTTKTTTTTTTSTTSSANDESIKKMEHELWDGWKNHDAKPFENNLGDDVQVLDDPGKGFQAKPAVLTAISGPDCNVSSYSFENEKVTWIDKDAAIYTYTANVDATCGGQKLPNKISASSVWVKRGGKWLGVFHQETPVMGGM